MSPPADPLPPPSGVELLEVRRISMTETAMPPMPPGDRLAMDRAWDELVRARPSLFDGPVVACACMRWAEPDGVELVWARTTYRHNVLRRVPGATSWLPSLFVAVVQPTEDGRLLVGCGSSVTTNPGRWQLPGGSVEPPAADTTLDVAALRRHAALELVEETGVDVPLDDLALWLVTRTESGGVGVLFLAPPRPEPVLRERFAALVAAEPAPEFEKIAFVRSPAGMADRADYLEPVIRRFATS